MTFLSKDYCIRVVFYSPFLSTAMEKSNTTVFKIKMTHPGKPGEMVGVCVLQVRLP